MADIVKTYAALSASSSRSDVAAVFNNIINAKPFTFDKTSRVELIKSIIADVKACGSKAKLSSKDATLALLSVKTLGKDPSGSAYIAQSDVLSTLLGLATTFIKDEPEAAGEALRCIANALLLIEQSRSRFISSEVNGGDTCILMLEKSSSPDHIFILSRILFLSTASGPSYVESVVENKHHGRTIVDILSSKLDLLSPANRNGAPSAKEATVDLLKFIFNLLLHYPKLTEEEPQYTMADGERKIMGDFWSSKLDGILPSLLRMFYSLPPTSPAPITAPLTHVIHSLIAIPVNNALKPIWLGSSPPSVRNSTSSSPKIKTPALVDSVPGSRSDSPTQSPVSPKPSTLDRALSVLSAGRRSLSRTPSPSTAVPFDILQRAYDLLEQALAHYFPDASDPDDVDIRKRAKAESQDSVEDILSPLIVLITRLCAADEGVRARLRQWLVPVDLDRSSRLEERADTLGRCLRLLASVHHPRLKDSIGEMLYAMCDSNASVLSGLVGYGNVAGFLFHKGILSAPSPGSGSSSVPQTTASGEPMDPITGTVVQPRNHLSDMTDEEKEREMEKLFVLFDRLEKTGALPPDQNPIRKGIQQGKLG